MKHILLTFLDFSKKERTGIYILLVVSTCTWILPVFFSNENIDLSSVEITILDAKIKRLKKDSLPYFKPSIVESHTEMNKNSPIEEHALFNFDPNKIGVEEWINLGVKEKTAQTILKYVRAGGRFRDKQDLKKIFGLSPYQAERLMPYVLFSKVTEDIRDKQVYIKKKFEHLPVELNEADSNKLMFAPGIGQKLSAE
jgi:hypothetical protein